MRMQSSFAACLLSIVLTGTSLAHEFYLEPDTYRPKAGEALRIAMREGERFAGLPYPRDAAKIRKFSIVGPDGEAPVMGLDGRLISFARTSSAGVYVLGYESVPRVTRLEADVFERYLREEGLENAALQRAQRHETQLAARDAYHRFAKLLLCTDAAADTSGFDRTVGHLLEITPIANPFRIAPGERLEVRVTFRGQPLAGAAVVFVQQGAPRELTRVVTDAEGRAAVRLAVSGRWMATTVTMQRSDPGEDSDWSSYWASLIFETPAGESAE